MYVATQGIAPHFKYMLKEKISKSDAMAFSCDECLNEIRKTCKMNVIVRYWSETAKSESKTLGIKFLWSCKTPEYFKTV